MTTSEAAQDNLDQEIAQAYGEAVAAIVFGANADTCDLQLDDRISRTAVRRVFSEAGQPLWMSEKYPDREGYLATYNAAY